MNIADFRRTNCKLLSTMAFMFKSIVEASNNNPCPGCSYYNHGNCPDFKKMLLFDTPRGKNMPTVVETNAQMASRLGITKRQASKLRNQK